jgi:hypothetical protein
MQQQQLLIVVCAPTIVISTFTVGADGKQQNGDGDAAERLLRQ